MTNSEESADRIPRRWREFDREMREETCHHHIPGVDRHTASCPHSGGGHGD